MTEKLAAWLETPFGKAIKQHIDNGIAIFPLHGIKDFRGKLDCTCGTVNCKNAGKHPYIKTAPHGFKNAVTTIEEAGALFEYREDLNVGAATGERSAFFVIDIDDKDNGKGSESLERLRTQMEVPETLTFKTGNGRHLIYDHPKGLGLGCSTNSFGSAFPGIDTRGDGGYIVIYPSLHKNGTHYAVLENLPISDLPQDIIDTLRNKEKEELKRNGKNLVPQTPRIEYHGEREWTDDDVADALSFLDPGMTYWDWFEIGVSLHDYGCDWTMWDNWSRGCAQKYEAGLCARKWDTFHVGGGRTIGTVIKKAMLQGWQPGAQQRAEVSTSAFDSLIASSLKKLEHAEKPPVAQYREPLEDIDLEAMDFAEALTAEAPEPAPAPQKTPKKKEAPAAEIVTEREASLPEREDLGENQPKPPENLPSGKKRAKREKIAQVFPFDPLAIQGPIGDTVRWITETAILPQPELALLNTLAFAASVFGRRYKSELNTRTNIYLVGVADTGEGKDHSRKCIGALADAAKLSHHIGPNSIRSDSGMLRGLMRNPSQLMMLDEFGMLMQGIADQKAAGHVKAISRAITILYSTSNSTYHHGDYADERATPIKIPLPNLCIYGTTTQESYTRSLTSGAIRSGELNRFMTFPAREVVITNFDAAFSEPSIDMVEWWKQFDPINGKTLGHIVNDGVVIPEPVVVKWGECQDIWKRLFTKQRENGGDKENPLFGVWSRYAENALKIAMIFAIARDADAPVLDAQDFEYAEAIVTRSIDYMMELAHNNMADSENEAAHKEILRFIVEKGKDGASKSELLRAFRKYKLRDIDGLLGALLEEETVASAQLTTKGRKKVVFYASGGLSEK